MAENNYVVVLLDQWGRVATKISPKGEEVELRQMFAKHQDCERWAHRRLIQDCYPGSVALIQSTRMMAKDGTPLTLRITREEAFSPHFPKARGPAVKVTLSKNAPLTFKMTCHQTRVEFSRG